MTCNCGDNERVVISVGGVTKLEAHNYGSRGCDLYGFCREGGDCLSGEPTGDVVSVPKEVMPALIKVLQRISDERT